MNEFDKKMFTVSTQNELRCYLVGPFGTNQMVYIKYAEAEYQIDDTLAGVVSYYKIHRALRLPYSPQTATTWKFFESFFMNEQSSDASPQVSTLINELRIFTQT